ncbi:MAG: hypothetical protein RIR39_1790 [Pseudomonadota bacterium]|jgi:hypothetical protein
MEKVIKVIPMDDYILVLNFDTGEWKRFDVKPYLEMGVFKQLKDISKFKQAYVDYGTVVWPGEIDIAPETLYDLSVDHHQ